jgi:hypothetical protein
MSDDDYPPLLFGRFVGQLGEKAWLDGYHACRLALREQVTRHGIQRVQADLRLDIPESEIEAWRETLAECPWLILHRHPSPDHDAPRSTPSPSPLK